MRTYALVLGLLALVFLGRVLGQLVVAGFAPDFLPPMHEWYSGLIPYPMLLSIQIAMLMLQARISLDLYRGSGRFATPRPRFGVGVRWFSYVYFGAMVLRYGISMSRYPERRWFGGTIPIVLHWVLAGYLYVWSRFHTHPPLLQGR